MAGIAVCGGQSPPLGGKIIGRVGIGDADCIHRCQFGRIVCRIDRHADRRCIGSFFGIRHLDGEVLVDVFAFRQGVDGLRIGGEGVRAVRENAQGAVCARDFGVIARSVITARHPGAGHDIGEASIVGIDIRRGQSSVERGGQSVICGGLRHRADIDIGQNRRVIDAFNRERELTVRIGQRPAVGYGKCHHNGDGVRRIERLVERRIGIQREDAVHVADASLRQRLRHAVYGHGGKAQRGGADIAIHIGGEIRQGQLVRARQA